MARGQLKYLCLVLAFLPALAQSGNDIHSDTKNRGTDQDATRLLSQVEQSGLLNSYAPGAASFSRNLIDIKYDQALLAAGLFDKFEARLVPQATEIDTLNRFCFAMLQHGVSEQQAITKLEKFADSSRIPKSPSFKEQLRPGLAAGKLIWELKHGNTQLAIPLADEVVGFRTAPQDTDANHNIYKAELYKHLIAYCLELNQPKEAAALFAACQDLPDKNFRSLAIGVIDRFKYMPAKASVLEWLHQISIEHPNLAVEVAGRLLGQFPGTQHNTLLSKKEQDDHDQALFEFIRRVEHRIGRIIEFRARLARLESQSTPEHAKSEIANELISHGKSNVQQESVWEYLPAALAARGRTRELEDLVEQTPNLTIKTQVLNSLVDALTQAKRHDQAAAILADLPLQPNSPYAWYSFGTRAVNCHAFALADDAISQLSQKNEQRSGLRNWRPEKLQIQLLAARSAHASPNDAINFLEQVAKEAENNSRSTISTLTRFLDSEELPSKFAIHAGTEVAEQFVNQIPETFFRPHSRPSRLDLHQQVVASLLKRDKTSEARKYAKRHYSQVGNPVIFRAFIHDQPFPDEELDRICRTKPRYRSLVADMMRSSSDNGDWKRAENRFLKLIELLQTNKGADYVHFSHQSIKPAWVNQHFRAISKITDKQSLRAFLTPCIESLAGDHEIASILKTATLVRDQRAKCHLLLDAFLNLKKHSVVDNSQFPMHLPNPRARRGSLN